MEFQRSIRASGMSGLPKIRLKESYIGTKFMAEQHCLSKEKRIAELDLW